ncbi:Receptor-like serine/threonine-protein kinase SD1-8 [Cardamine amara subsp. amara]|uniref:Receptor-like serine/threonine-protein kinase SD1-8 n=1 Tax=Cardamine amara subsp. amara TaxID=228776 RepID=A0ABD1A9E3_CARAN
MRSAGTVQQLWWNKTSSRWDLLWASLNDKCDIFQVCGAFGYCDISTKCNCMRGFEPKDPEAWALENANDGCVRTTPLSCNNDEFIRLSEIKLPDLTNATVEWNMGLSSVKSDV